MTRRRLDRGDAEVVGLVLIAPVIAAFVAVVVWLGRQVDTRTQVRQAADAAAQAAAHEREPGRARQAAERAAIAMLTDTATCAGGPTVEIDLGGFTPGGIVTATVTCRSARHGLELVAHEDANFRGTSTAVIDTFRSAAP